MPEQAASGAGDLHPAFNAPAAPSAPAATPPAGESPPGNPRSRGHSPARDAREAAAAAEPERTIKFGENEFSEQEVRAALAERVEREVLKRALPASALDYALKLPGTFETPVGMSVELDPTDPLLQAAQRLSHRHGLTQEQFSDFLGVYAASEISKAQRLDSVRQANLKLLGSAANQRIDALSTFLTATAGKDGQAFSEFLRRFPSAAIVRALEHVQRQLSDQGGAMPASGHRESEAPKPNIGTMSDGLSYNEVRSRQDAALGAQVRRDGRRR